jgi:hypothetical protein
MRKNLNVIFRNREVLTGIQRLAQSVVIELMTELGSIKYQPERGTMFVPRCRAAKTEFDVNVAFSAAAARLKRTFNSRETIGTPAAERLLNLKLDNLIISDEPSLTCVVTIISKAKTAVKIDMPPIML